MEGAPLKPLRTPMITRDTHDTTDHVEEDREEDEYDQDEVDGFIASHGSSSRWSRAARARLFAAFMIFGELNNVLYVIILSAALDLVPSTTPKGVVAFFNIFPALLTKVSWPLLSRGKIRYARRVCLCTACSWIAMVIIALSGSVRPRLFGIALASFSSGLGELTFLQLTTTLPTAASSRTALGAWSSGTGFAGISGAGIWWLLRGLGVKGGLGVSSLLPLFFPLAFFIILPSFDLLQQETGAYQRVPSDIIPESISPESSIGPSAANGVNGKAYKARLSTADKIELLKPLILQYMVPLCTVYIEEYVINSGIAPTLVFPLPTAGIWSLFFKSPRDYYPFWSLTYQTFVFISRSSLTLGLPPIPRRYLAVPALLQFLVLSLLSLQACRFIFSSPAYTPPAPEPVTGVDRSITFAFILICLEGLFGGSSYVNTFYHVGREGEEGGEGEEGVKRKMEREFRVGSTGASDSFGILFASLISMPFELALCNAQIAQGRSTCRDL